MFLFSKINGLLGDMDIRIANKYRLGRKIGGGSFGDIYLGKYFSINYNYIHIYSICSDYYNYVAITLIIML